MLKKNLYMLFVIVVAFCFVLSSSTISVSDEKQQQKPQTGNRGMGVKKEAPPADFGNYHAILIGINAYEDWPPLRTPINDISALKLALVTHYGFQEANITIVDDNTPVRPTHSNILKVIRDKSRKLTEKDNLLIYYAGHGQIDDLTGDGYWIPISAKVNDVSTWLPHSAIRSVLESAKIKVKNLLLVADSCYSGIMLRGVNDASKITDVEDENYADKLRERSGKKSREVITSGGNEPVIDMISGSENSLFAHYFLKALNSNQRRYIDMETLFQTDIRPKVAQTGKQIPANFRLRAITDEDGLFILTKLSVQEKVATLQKDLETSGKSEQEKLEMKTRIESLLAKLANAEAKNLDAEKKAGELEVKQKQLMEKQAKLTTEQQTRVAELDTLKKKLDDDTKNLETEKQRLAAEKGHLSNRENQYKADEERLKSQLTQGKHVDEEMRATLEKEKMRLDDERKKIAAERNNLGEKEQTQIAYQARLKKEDDERRLKEEADRKKIDALRKEVADLEAAKVRISEEKVQLENSMASVSPQLHKKMQSTKDRFKDNGDGTVTDTQTGMMWVRNANRAYRSMNWEDAMKYTEEMNLQGNQDWRLPSKAEFQDLIDKEGVEVALPSGHPFKDVVKFGDYWTSSINPLGPMYSYVVNVGNGSTRFSSKNKMGFVWAVRFAGPQQQVKK
ncbi:MAG: DUF1566 domain-containing protein [Deltaproteobacteria bacterium]